jgi:NitT/TauT family transport system ATP-binding protein
MPASPPIVTLEAVEKRYGDGPLILDGITLRAERGDFITLIGPSGCGKSTLLRLIAGLSPLTHGTLHVGDSTGLTSRSVDEVSFVFQEATLLPWLTTVKNVELPLRLKGVAPAERAEISRRVLSLVRLSEKAGAYPRQLSGGQKMRVALARALSVSPRILLLDEPFGALDEMTRNHLNEELLAIREQEKWTAFFVTHSVSEAVFLSNRILVLAANPGRIHAEIAVDLPYPRTPDTRFSDAYQRQVAHVTKVVRSVET